MKERPILFSAPMVRAILDGRKTQTRRIAPITDLNITTHPGGMTTWNVRFYKPIRGVLAGNSGGKLSAEHARRVIASSFNPYGRPGDRLWVRETFAGSIAYERRGYPLKEWGNKIWYLADGEPSSGQWTRPRPSIHMPRWASRITLEITEVRVERLKDISEEDAVAEGLEVDENGHAVRAGDIAWGGARCAFADLWESINGADSWAANPWVWVVGFRRVTP